MSIPKVKIVKVLSNGSLNFCYKTSNNFKLFDISEKDCKNFHFHLKMSNTNQVNQKKNSKYKNKYFIIK